MVSKGDRRAAVVLLGVAFAGVVVRLLALSGSAPGDISYRPIAGDRPSQDSVVARATRLARPLAPDEKINIDRAPAEELARLPRIGPALAARIVADRAANGPFGSLAGLDRVAGVGPKLLDGIRVHATFSGRPPEPDQRQGLVRLSTATEAELTQLPGIGPVKARAIVEYRRRHGPYLTVESLERVAGIGRATIDRIRQLVVP
ncbi:MAG: helix-hairpin-helix domain-containing protein [Gemmatimonadota bacterium]|nr:MAG: helix-hairpin-helix domain-containing protein [Gemmatimonadota bacterium]